MSAKLQLNKQLSAPKGVLHRGNIVIWERGSGESVSFAVIAVCVCTLLLFLIGIIQLNVGMKQLAQAASVASRAAAVCGSMEDAEELAQQVAESSITNGMVSGIRAEVEFVSGDMAWSAGNYIVVTVYGKMNVATKFFPSGERHKSIMSVIEGTSYSSSDLTLLAALIQAEGGDTDSDMFAVGTIVMNRLESPRFPSTLADVIYAPGQFQVTWNGALERCMSNPDPDALRIAANVLSGARYPGLEGYYYFLQDSSTDRTEGIAIGGNFFFREWSDG